MHNIINYSLYIIHYNKL